MSVQPEYFGGTPTSTKGYRKPRKSIFESVMEDLKQSPIYQAGNLVATGARKSLESVTGPLGSPQAGIVGLDTFARNRAAGMSNERASELAAEARTQAFRQQVGANMGVGAGPVGIGLGAVEAAWSYGVARPVSTGLLLTDPGSPLYRQGTVDQTIGRDEYGRRVSEVVPVESGFQWDDVSQAWRRSADISFGRSAAANPLFDSLLPNQGKVGNIDEYDPWSDYDMAMADKNPFYNFVTGATDGALQVVVPPVVKVGRLAAFDKLGLRTTITSADDLATLRFNYESHRNAVRPDPVTVQDVPTAAPARTTTWGQAVDRLAGETNLGRIMADPIVANSNGIDKLTFSRILQQTNDPDTVNELLLASRGDVTALRRLQEAAPDHVWALADMNSNLRSAAINGEAFRPEGDDLARVNQIFDSALARDDYFREVRTAFAGAEGSARVPSTWMPTQSAIVEGIRTRGRNLQYAVKSGDYTSMPRWVAQASSSRVGQPATVFLQWMGSRQPLGTVTNSGARPNDLWTELTAQLDSVPVLRGNRPVVVGYDIVNGEPVARTVSAQSYRQMLFQRLAEGDAEGYLKPTYQGMEDEIVGVMADTLGLDRAKVSQMVAGYRRALDENYSYMVNNGGYLFDEAGARILLEPQTVRQLLDSFPTLPLDEIYNAMRGELNPLLRTGETLQGAAINIFDAGMKIFRTNVLFRVGYTGKNSIAEPWLASYLAHGTFLADEGIMSTLGNFAANRANDLKRVAYLTQLNRLVRSSVKDVPKASRAEARKALQALVDQRHLTQRLVDDLHAMLEDIKAGRGISPATAADFDEVVRGRLVEAQMRMDQIEAALDDRLPEWRQVVEPASLTDISMRLREFRAITGQDSKYADDLRQEIADIREAARSRTLLPTQEQRATVEALQKQIDRIDARLAKLSEDYNRPKVDKTGVSVAQAQEDDIARGRDMQAISLQRQRTSLIEQRDAAVEELKRMENAGVDVFVDPVYTANEAASLQAAEATLARIEALKGAIDPKIVDRVQDLQNLHDEVLAMMRIPNNDPTRKIQALQQRLDALDRAIRSAQVKQGREVSKIDRLQAGRSYRGSGDGMMYVYVGGERFAVPAAFSERAIDFGQAYRAEASAATTNRLTLDPSYRVSGSMLRWQAAGGPVELLPTDTRYWPELAWVSNAYFRGDKLVQRILEGQSRADIAKWLTTPEGVAYQKSMGKKYLVPRERYADGTPLPDIDPPTASRLGDAGRVSRPSALNRAVAPRRRQPRVLLESTTELDDVIRLVEQYLPDPKVRQLVARQEVTAGELQKMLGGRDDLSRIVGEDLQYNAGPVRQLGQWVNTALDKIWGFVATMPEDRLARWPFYQREFRMQLERRAGILSSQGVRMTSEQFDALRQAAHRETLVEMERTFYNIRRYSTPVYASRFLLSFPGAFFNSFYRYGRFAAREPERVFQTMLFAGNALSELGVDENGNPVGNDLSKAVYLLIPGTKRSDTDTGIRVPVASFASLAIGYPSLSYISTILVSSVVKQNPTREEVLKQALGPAYDEIFPYGLSRNPFSVMFGSYQKDLWSGLQVSDERFIQTSVQMYQDAMAQWERNGNPGEAPSFEQAVSDTRNFYLARAGIKFFNPFTTDSQAPGQLMRDAWYEIRAAYPDNPELARQRFVESYGDWARWYTYSSGDYSAFVPSTIDAYERIWVDHPGLARELVSLNPQDPSMVQLLAVGTDGQFSQAVSNYLRDNPLPDDDVPVVSRMTPEAFNNMVRVSDGWAWYNRNKALYTADRERLVALRDSAATEDQRQYYREWVSNVDAQWKSTWQSYGELNEPWLLSKIDPGGSKAETAAIFLDRILKNRSFMQTDGKDPLWQKIDQFVTDRAAAKAALADAGSTENRMAVKSSFYDYVQNELAKGDPAFAAFFDRYFASEWVDE